MLPDWVKSMLSENNLDEYIEIFEKNKLDTVEVLSELNDNDLINIGVDLLGDRKKLLNIFRKNEVVENNYFPNALNNNNFIAKPIEDDNTRKEEKTVPIIINNATGDSGGHTGLAGLLGGIIGAVAVIAFILYILSNETFNL